MGGPSIRGAQATLGGVPHPTGTKINKTAPSLGDSGSSSIISRKRKPIRESGWTQF